MDSIPENILAFRTITTLLEMIQPLKPRPLHLLPNEHGLSFTSQKELKLADALSTVAVIDHEVVAVVANRTNGQLKVIACTNPSYDHEDQQLIKQAPLASSIFRIPFLFIKNYRRSDPDEVKRMVPIIDDTTPPPDLKEGDTGLKGYLMEHCYRTNPTFREHLHILNRLFTMQHPTKQETPSQSLSNHLIRYVIATCYRKMKRRLNHATLSQPYLRSLVEAIGSPFCEPPQMPSATDISYDRLFLTYIYGFFLEDTRFVGTFPNIVEQAKLTHKGEPFQLYSKDTHSEFHQLLLNFLALFRDSLDTLANLGVAMDASNNNPHSNSKTSLDNVLLYGLALQKLSKSSALQTHLQAIAPSLEDHRRAHTLTSTLNNEQDGACNELDEELAAVQPYVTTDKGAMIPLWRSYRDWLRLIVVHFDAAHLLGRYFAEPPLQSQTISFKILVAPYVDKILLPWNTLLTSPHFPTGDQDATNEEIVQFLTDSISANPTKALGSAKGLSTVWEKLNKEKVDKEKWNKQLERVKQEVKNLRKSKLPGWSDHADDLGNWLENLQSSDDSKLESKMTEKINLLIYSARFFQNFAKATNPDGFKGTLHCEACLASLLPGQNKPQDFNAQLQRVSEEMTQYSQIIGVSKLCCPICQYLLHLLAGDGPTPFVTRGSHSTVTACTLPIWLPANIVDRMNVYFGKQLKQELVELMGRSGLLRSRTQSTGSRRISTESVGRDQIGDPLPTGQSQSNWNDDLRARLGL